MKRVVLCVLVVLQLLIGSAAQAERRLFIVESDPNGYYDVTGAMAWVSDTVVDGEYNVEGRVVIQNTSDEILTFPEAELWLYDDEKAVARMPTITVTPESLEPEGFALLTFSGPGVRLGEFEQPAIWISCKPYRGEAKEIYYGMGKGWFEKSQYSEGGRMKMDIAELPKGKYDINLIAIDKNGYFVWAEDCSINTELGTVVSQGIEDYEIKLFREFGFDLDLTIYGAVYKK